MRKYTLKIRYILIAFSSVIIVVAFLGFGLKNELSLGITLVWIIVAVLSGLSARMKGRSFLTLFNVSCWSSFVTFMTLLMAGSGNERILLAIIAFVLSPLAGLIPAFIVRPTERILKEINIQMYQHEFKKAAGQGIICGNDNVMPVVRNTIPFTNRPLEYRHKIEFASATLAIILLIGAYSYVAPGVGDVRFELPGSVGFFLLTFLSVIAQWGRGNAFGEWLAVIGALFFVYFMFFYSSIKMMFMCLAYKDFSRRQFYLMIALLLSSIAIPVATVMLFAIEP